MTIRGRSAHLHPSRGGIRKQGGKADDGEYDYRFDTDIVKQLVAGGCIEQVWHEAKAIPRANRQDACKDGELDRQHVAVRRIQ